jgi:hypothetical protein
MSRPRSNLVDIAPIEPEATEALEPAETPKVDDPNARRKLSLYVKQAHYRAIRKVAADRDGKMQDVVDEALTAYFRTKGY